MTTSDVRRAPGDILFLIAAEPEYGDQLRRRFDAVIVGVGPIEAAIGTALALEERRMAGRLPSLAVSLGSAGSRHLEVGSVLQVSRVSWRDMDASRLGFEKGVTPFADHDTWIDLPALLPGVATATLSTGGEVLGHEEGDDAPADLIDMETFAVVRACQRFGVPVIGLRGVSDGPGNLKGIDDWHRMLGLLDERLAEVVDLIPDATEALRSGGSPNGIA